MSTCIILAGGHSTRMGQDKRRLRLWGALGPTLLAHTVALGAACCTDVIVVLNDPEQWPDLPARLTPDAYPGAGPLGGLATGLATMTTDRALLLACDMPLLQPVLLQALVTRPLDGDACIPRQPGAPMGHRNRQDLEPLLAVYRRTCLPAIMACLARGDYRMVAPLPAITVCSLEPSWWRRYDPDGRSFLNVNRPDDLDRALRLIDTTASCPTLL